MTGLLILISLIFTDRCIPQMARLYAVGQLPFGNRELVLKFNKHYGWIRFPRTAFIVAAPAIYYVYKYLENHQDWVIFVLVSDLVLFGLFAAFDVFAAGRSVRKSS